MLRLTVLEGVEKGRVLSCAGPRAGLGTASDNELVLSDPAVSRHHGALTLEEGRCTYEDLGSTNGSAVESGGERAAVDPQGPGRPLEAGDLIIVGETVLRFELAEAERAEAAGETVLASRRLEDLEASRQRQLDSRERLLAGYELERDIGLAFDPEAMVDAILEGTLRAFPSATHAILLLIDKKTRRPRRQVARVKGEEGRHESELPISMSVATRVLEEGQAVLFQDVAAEFEGSMSVAAAGIRSSLCAPLWTGEETVGLIQVENRGGRGGFTDGDLDQLTIFANRAALAIVGSELSEVERRNALMRDLSGMITHDLNGPLTSVMAFLEMVREEGLEEPQREYVEIALGASKWLAVLVSGILDVAKMESAEVEPKREPLELEEEVREALSLIRYQFDEKQIQLELNLAADLPRVAADREMFRRIIVNLAGNSVSLAPSESKLTISAEVGEGGREMVVSVRDEGPGIPKEYQERIFDKFVQAASREQSHRKLSVGLGLSFCRLAVEAHGGRIWVESEPGEGACFYFSLPLEARSG